MLPQSSQVKFPCSGPQSMTTLGDKAIKVVNILIPWVLIQCDSVIISGGRMLGRGGEDTTDGPPDESRTQ